MVRRKTLELHDGVRQVKLTSKQVKLSIIVSFMKFKTKLSRDLYVHRIRIKDSESMAQFYARIRLILTYMHDKTYRSLNFSFFTL